MELASRVHLITNCQCAHQWVVEVKHTRPSVPSSILRNGRLSRWYDKRQTCLIDNQVWAVNLDSEGPSWNLGNACDNLLREPEICWISMEDLLKKMLYLKRESPRVNHYSTGMLRVVKSRIGMAHMAPNGNEWSSSTLSAWPWWSDHVVETDPRYMAFHPG